MHVQLGDFKKVLMFLCESTFRENVVAIFLKSTVNF